MVRAKKASKAGKQNQVENKKPVKVQETMGMEDSDDFSDSDDSGSVEMAPVKTPKGKQSLGDKRVSFQVPGKNTPKNTPGKTPAKNNIKKQLTPAKAGLKEFAGMKPNKKSVQVKNEEEDDDDDDDEDDSDFDVDLDLADDDMDEDVEGDDDDDDDDDEEDDDEEDDDDDSEDDDEVQAVSNKVQKQKIENGKKSLSPNKAQTPKAAQTPNAAQTPKVAQTPKSAKKENLKDAKQGNLKLDEAERRRQRNLKQLYVGNLPNDIDPNDLKGLSSDILSCHMPRYSNSKSSFAFLQFESEEKAEENFHLLKNKKVKGEVLSVDFVGEKSLNKKQQEKKEVQKEQFNLKKLFIAGLPLDCTISQISKYFPKAYNVCLNNSTTFRTATVCFWSEDEGTAAFEKNKEIDVGGVTVSVLHALQPNVHHNKRKNQNKKNENKKNHPAKKMKFEPKQKDSSDDE